MYIHIYVQYIYGRFLFRLNSFFFHRKTTTRYDNLCTSQKRWDRELCITSFIIRGRNYGWVLDEGYFPLRFFFFFFNRIVNIDKKELDKKKQSNFIFLLQNKN